MVLAAGCDNFATVQDADSIDAYETYIAESPNSRFALQAESRLEELYLQKAKEDGTLEAYDTYLTKYPDGIHLPEALIGREVLLFEDAYRKNTEEMWQKFLDEHPRADRKRDKYARKAVKAAPLIHHVDIGGIRIEDINLAEDPTGPLNGKGIYADVTNNADKAIAYLGISMAYLDREGNILMRKEWPAVAPQFPVPMEERYLEPIEPGETRVWEFTTGDVPGGWSGQVLLRPMRFEFVKE
jgi:tetratricopeptide (TPR) repeat protein